MPFAHFAEYARHRASQLVLAIARDRIKDMVMQNRKRPSLFNVLRQNNSRRRTPDENGNDIRNSVAIALIASGMVLGGGGSSNPLTEIVLQLIAALLMAVWCLAPGEAPRRISGWVPLVCALVVALPLIQLIPLPPSIWHALPGRDVEIASLSLVGRESAWMPWSVTPSRTLAAFLAMIPALAMMWFVASLDERGRNGVLRAIAVMALVSVVLGAFQLAAPTDKVPSFYSYIHRGYVIGFQANRNAEVDVLLIGVLAATALFAGRDTRSRQRASAMIVYGAMVLVLLSGAVLSGSRGGILLIPATALFALLIVQPGGFFARRTLIGICAVALVGVLAAWVLRDNAAIGKVAARFAADKDFRTELWTDTMYAIGQYWPFGGGMGSFVQLMTPVERLEVVDPTLPSRAHNDYLEILLEGGIFGVLLIVAIATCFILMALKSWKTGVVTRAHSRFAFAAFFIVAAHSLVDYPLRSMSLAMLVGAAAGLLAPSVSARGRSNAQ